MLERSQVFMVRGTRLIKQEEDLYDDMRCCCGNDGDDDKSKEKVKTTGGEEVRKCRREETVRCLGQVGQCW